MTVDELKSVIRNEWRQLGTPDGQGKGIVCPICQNGSGQDGDGLREIPSSNGLLHCFKCENNMDILDVIQKEQGIGFQEALKYCADRLGLSIDDELPQERKLMSSNDTNTKKQIEPKQDMENFFLSAFGALKESDVAKTYLSKRGISLQTALLAPVGFVQDWKSSKAPEAVPTSPRLIFPTGEFSYSTRDVRNLDDIPKEYQSYIKQKEGKGGLWNTQALGAGDVVFVVEGEMDALSILEVGGEVGGNAVALGSTSQARQFVEMMRDRVLNGQPVPAVVVALDNDDAGKKTSKKMMDELQKFSIPCIERNVSGSFKDPNEALQNSRPDFADSVLAAITTAKEIAHKPVASDTVKQDEEPAEAKDDFLFEDAYHDDFLANIKAGFDPIKTGLENLDFLLGGGLYPELYTLGAATGAGKTTLLTQIGDNAARNGIPVLYIALEMSRDEIKAKSVSRLMYQLWKEDKTKYLEEGLHSDQDILYNRVDNDLLWAAADMYLKEIARNTMICESVGNISVKEIRERAVRVRNLKQKSPLIVVDYLQLLKPEDYHMTERQTIDTNITALKQLSRDLKTPVILISSLNRDATTNGKQENESFKESGGIEYTSSVTLLMNFTQDKDKDGKIADTYLVELTMKKCRHGKNADSKIRFAFDGRSCVFTPRTYSDNAWISRCL